jgi:hypothetical protein
MRRALLPLIASVTAFACSDAPTSALEEPVDRVSAPIQGGTQLDGARGAVALCIGDEPPPRCRFACSGTLIAQNLVLTSRHCLETVGRPAERPDCAHDQFGGLQPNVTSRTVWVTTNTVLSTSTSGWHRSRDLLFPLVNRVCGEDVATIILEDKVFPSEASPVRLAIRPTLTDPTYSRDVALVGLGESNATDTASLGVRRVRQNVAITCIPGDPVLDCAKRSEGGDPKEFLVREGGCSGDSGGPAFDQAAYTRGEFLQLGTLARAGELSGSCIDNRYIRIDAVAPFLTRSARAAATAGNYEVPAWAAEPLRGVQPGAATPFAFGELGAECDADSDCKSGKCASYDGALSFTCVEPCAAGGQCAADFVCREGGSVPLCFYSRPAPPADSGCALRALGGRRTLSELACSSALALLLAIAVAARRRARRP